MKDLAMTAHEQECEATVILMKKLLNKFHSLNSQQDTRHF